MRQRTLEHLRHALENPMATAMTALFLLQQPTEIPEAQPRRCRGLIRGYPSGALDERAMESTLQVSVVWVPRDGNRHTMAILNA